MDQMDNPSYQYTTNIQKSEYPLITLPRNSVDPRFSQMMNPRQSNWNTGTFHQPNPELTVARMAPPQYGPSANGSTVRPGAWEPQTTRNNVGKDKIPSAGWKASCSKFVGKMTSTKMVFFLTGLILAGIPLAVMTTLWVNNYSKTSGSSTGSGSATNASFSGTLPVQCFTYMNLIDTFRNLQNGYPCCYSPYDSNLAAGWYRVSGSAGTQLVVSPISITSTCGESYPGYFNGSLPSTPGTFTTGNVCFYTGVPCGYSISPISVMNCNGYYIYYLVPTGSSSYRYCTTY